MNLRTPLIVLITILAISACIFFAMKLLSITPDSETPSTSNEDETLILRAVDGDTLELISGEGETTEAIRLLCVDTPEEGKEGYEEAKAFLSLKLSENIRIERQGLDNYNRTLAWVYFGETLVNKEIIDNGYGTIFPYNGTNCTRVM